MKIKTIASFALGPILGAVLGVITLPIITWFFPQEDVGRISMLNITLSFTTMFFCLGLDQSYVREFHESKNKAQLLLMAYLPGAALLLTTIFIACIYFRVEIAKFIFNSESESIAIALAVMVLAAFTSRMLSLCLRMKEKGLLYSISQLIPKVSVLAIVFIYVLNGVEKSFSFLLYAYLISNVVLLFYILWNLREEVLSALNERVDLSSLREMLKFGLPLVVGGLAYWGLLAADKIMLRSLSSFEQLAIYSVSSSFAGAATVLQSIFTVIWAPTVYKWAKTGENLEKIEKVTDYVLLAVVFLISVTGIFSWIVGLLLPEKYLSVTWIMISCMGAPLLYTLSETTVVGIGITRKSLFALSGSFIALVVNVIGNWALVPHFGAKGAAVSTIISFYVFFILRTEFSSFLWFKIKTQKLYLITLSVVILSIIHTLLGDSLHSYMPLLWFLTLLFLLFFFRESLKEAYIFVRNKIEPHISIRDNETKK
ncbi:oligosaccharide flippase family protein [Vibrio diabolicus]|uniref:lipopolysaccharide biosynthesis protein n=1 Tax=Vibrio diabolicus TaxID=50719 RepID=UPI00215171C4|nr:oligosaccharide flippase family protein [Vibrio diabolicus]MCE3221735.1 oligosaccharide flippase family protein [Vibrio diabolicus]